MRDSDHVPFANEKASADKGVFVFLVKRDNKADAVVGLLGKRWAFDFSALILNHQLANFFTSCTADIYHAIRTGVIAENSAGLLPFVGRPHGTLIDLLHTPNGTTKDLKANSSPFRQ